jgi:predicted phosphodiesterase
MRVAVVSDIHANLHAFEAVLAAVEKEGVDAVWCLGDLVGYGPQPSRCCELAAVHADICLVGNHDLAVLGRVDLADFSPEAAYAARWTADVLSPEGRAYLEALEPSAILSRAALYHASPRDPVWEYILTDDAALAALELSPRSLVLVGHSHAALAVELASNGELLGGLAPAGTEASLAEGTRRLLNPGSVGQPRDGDPRAGWLLLDFEGRRASFRRNAYAVARTQTEIVEAGLPAGLAARLEAGV